VLVAGSGPAGFVAAIAAARLGAKTLLVERLGLLGGNLTAGGVLNIRQFNDGVNRLVIGGIPLEFARELQRRGRTVGDPQTALYLRHYPETTKLVIQEMLLGAGVNLLLHSPVVAAVTDKETVQGVIVETKSGREAILAKVVVDATGDGDVFARAGAAFDKRPRGEVMPMTMAFILGGLPKDRWPEIMTPDRHEAMQKAIQAHGSPTPLPGAAIFPTAEPGFAYVNGTRCFADCTDADDLTQAEIEGRRQVHALVEFVRRHVPGFGDCYVASTPSVTGTRESRRLRGLYALTRDDVLGARDFEDRIARGAYKIDVHSGRDGATLYEDLPPGTSYGIPYRCLVPEKVDGLLVAGRCLSAEPHALGSTRVMAICMATGQAAGVAAALAAKQGKQPRGLVIAELQDELRDQGAILDR
jgi:glycine/D-amino acid oxidase-like deaminating enzyme